MNLQNHFSSTMMTTYIHHHIITKHTTEKWVNMRINMNNIVQVNDFKQLIRHAHNKYCTQCKFMSD